MTPRTLIIAIVASVLLLALLGVAVYYAGEHRGEARTKIAALKVHQEEQHELEVIAQARADSTARLKDSLAHVTTAMDSLRELRAHDAATALTAASLARASATLDTASVTITSDTGPAHYAVAAPVVHQWALERAADARALTALTAQVAADSESITSRDAQLALDRVRDAERDSVDAAIHAQLADANATIKILQKERAPRFTFSEGVAVGAGSAGVIALLLALL